MKYLFLFWEKICLFCDEKYVVSMFETVFPEVLLVIVRV